MSCINPTAPRGETISERKPDSAAITATTRSGSSPCRGASSRASNSNVLLDPDASESSKGSEPGINAAPTGANSFSTLIGAGEKPSVPSGRRKTTPGRNRDGSGRPITVGAGGRSLMAGVGESLVSAIDPLLSIASSATAINIPLTRRGGILASSLNRDLIGKVYMIRSRHDQISAGVSLSRVMSSPGNS